MSSAAAASAPAARTLSSSFHFSVDARTFPAFKGSVSVTATITMTPIGPSLSIAAAGCGHLPPDYQPVDPASGVRPVPVLMQLTVSDDASQPSGVRAGTTNLFSTTLRFDADWCAEFHMSVNVQIDTRTMSVALMAGTSRFPYHSSYGVDPTIKAQLPRLFHMPGNVVIKDVGAGAAERGAVVAAIRHAAAQTAGYKQLESEMDPAMHGCRALAEAYRHRAQLAAAAKAVAGARTALDAAVVAAVNAGVTLDLLKQQELVHRQTTAGTGAGAGADNVDSIDFD
jgi:hypothetical protein